MQLSTESSYLKRSVMRDLLKLAVSPDIISLAGGLPAGEFLPLTQLQACMNTVLERDGSRALQYSPQHMPLRKWIAEWMQARSVDCSPEQVFITNGAQQGLNILSRLLLDPGEKAVVEATTFTGIQQVTAGRNADVLAVPTDLQTGVDVDALEEAFKQSPRLAILISDFHNPLGVSLTDEKRQRIAALAAQYQVPVIEDDTYSALRFEGEAIKPIKAYDEADMVFYVGSFSKMLAPTLRLGWLIAPAELIPQVTVLRESLDLESSTFIQRTVVEFMQRGYLEEHLSRITAANRERRDALHAALTDHFGDIAEWTYPSGGLFIWVTLPASIDTWQTFEQAVENQVAYIPGGAFAVKGGYTNTLRLNFSNVTPENIHTGIARLAKSVERHYDG